MGGQSKGALLSSVAGAALAPVTGGASLALPAVVGGISGAKHNGLTGALGGAAGAAGVAALGGAGLGAGLGAMGMEGMSAASALPSFLGGSGIGAGEQLVGSGLTPANSMMGNTAMMSPTSGYSFLNPVSQAPSLGFKDIAGGSMAAMNLASSLNPQQQPTQYAMPAPSHALGWDTRAGGGY